MDIRGDLLRRDAIPGLELQINLRMRLGTLHVF